jgi:hypothetical protein
MTTNEAIVAMLVEFVARERAMRDAIGRGGQQCNGSAPSINVSVLHELERMVRYAPDVAANYTTCFEDLARVTKERDNFNKAWASVSNTAAAAINDMWQENGKRKAAEADRDAARAEVEVAREVGFRCGFSAAAGYYTEPTEDEAWLDYQREREAQS